MRPETICFKRDSASIAQQVMPMKFSSVYFPSVPLNQDALSKPKIPPLNRQAIFIRSDLGEQRDMIFDGRSRLGNVLGMFF